MIKNILKYLLMITGISLVFYAVSAIKCNIDNDYSNREVKSFSVIPQLEETASIIDVDAPAIVNENREDDLFDDCYYTLFLNDTTKEYYAAKNVHQRMYPASTTKLMTAIVVCDEIAAGNINLDDIVTVNNRYDLTEHDLLPCAYLPGSKITVENLLYELLLESNNYNALILADYISGSPEAFCGLMNTKAMEIGATSTHFNNPHGLDDPLHYSTAYDLYLITRTAYKYDIIRTIDSVSEYAFSYTNPEGWPVNVNLHPTNLFFTDKADLPTNYHIEIWKTGTTYKSGHCLAMYVSKNDQLYFVFAATNDSKTGLYEALIKLLSMAL
ncbi:MAG: serine hydrolase [Eubacteriales bacterium]|nr:serine hydrolase [Lachnospiraceae bacterium]MDO5127717.1 serine hydrolase [Eubacteriales bacterium]